MKFVGIDLSANPRDCGICILEDDAVAHVSYGSKMADHPDWLVDLCTGADVVAVDVPFGWPKLFIETLKGYEIGTALERDRREYRFRETDLWLTEELPRKVAHRWSSVPPKPLSVSTDKLGSTTMVGTILLEALAGDFLLSPRESSLRPTSIEVYPAASLWAWSLPHTDYKKGYKAPTMRLEILRSLEEAFEIRTKGYEQLLFGSDHCLDALVAALTAQEYAGGDTFDPPERVSEDTLKVEGWIRILNHSLKDASGT